MYITILLIQLHFQSVYDYLHSLSSNKNQQFFRLIVIKRSGVWLNWSCSIPCWSYSEHCHSPPTLKSSVCLLPMRYIHVQLSYLLYSVPSFCLHNFLLNISIIINSFVSKLRSSNRVKKVQTFCFKTPPLLLHASIHNPQETVHRRRNRMQ